MLLLDSLPMRAPISGPYGQAEHGDEEQQAEEEPPEHAPASPRANQVMVRMDVVTAVLVPEAMEPRIVGDVGGRW